MAKSAKKKKPAKQSTGDVASARQIIKTSAQILLKNWKLFGLFIILYGTLLAIFVRGPIAVSINDIKSTVSEALPSQAGNSALVAAVLVGESADISQASAAYGTFLFLIFTMAIIWLLRASFENKNVRLRDGFYKGMYGLIPVTLIFVVILLQLLPVAIGGAIYSIISLNSIAVSTIENVVVWIFMGALILLSLNMLSSSFQAVYIASLPNVAPLEALRQAKKLVKGRRFKVMSRILVGVFIYGVISFAGLLVFVAILPVAASWWWWFVGLLALPVGHAYLYSLYRSLL